MFEQTFLTEPDSARRPWSLAVSLAVQCAFTGVIILVPLIHTAQLAWHPAPAILYMPPRPAPPPAAVVQQASSASAAMTRPMYRPVFTAPRHTPSSIVTLPDPTGAPDFILASSSAGSGAVQFGPPSLGIENGPAPRTVTQSTPAPKAAPLRVSNGVQAAKLLQQPKPLYPPLAKAARISGLVRLQAVIGRDGTIRNLQLVTGPPLLVKAAFEAVSRWTYKPTLLNGEPVEVFTEIDVNFTLNQ